MLKLPATIIDLMKPFAPCFCSVTTWTKAQILLIGTILTPGKRVVTEALREMGLGQSVKFTQYHQVLNRTVWSPLDLAQVLLKLLVKTFTQPDEPLVFGIDPTLERRWGHKIVARGIYRDAVRSSDSHFGQSQWSALGQSDAADADWLGTTGVGTAGDDGVVALGALLPAARTPCQDAVGAQSANAQSVAPLVASTGSGRGGG